MSNNPLALALAATQVANTILRLIEQSNAGAITPEEAEQKAIEAWDDTAARVVAADQRFRRIHEAMKARGG